MKQIQANMPKKVRAKKKQKTEKKGGMNAFFWTSRQINGFET